MSIAMKCVLGKSMHTPAACVSAGTCKGAHSSRGQVIKSQPIDLVTSESRFISFFIEFHLHNFILSIVPHSLRNQY